MHIKLMFLENYYSNKRYKAKYFYKKLVSELKRSKKNTYSLETVWSDDEEIIAESKIVFFDEIFRFKFNIETDYKQKGIMTYIFCSYIIFIIKNHSKFATEGRIVLSLVESGDAWRTYQQEHKSVYGKILMNSHRERNYLKNNLDVSTWKKRILLLRYYRQLRNSVYYNL